MFKFIDSEVYEFFHSLCNYKPLYTDFIRMKNFMLLNTLNSIISTSFFFNDSKAIVLIKYNTCIIFFNYLNI